MNRYLTQRPFVSFTVFIVACVGSIFLVDKQLSSPPVAVVTVSRRPEVFVSSKFTRVGRVPTAEGPAYEMHFINPEDGWLAKGKHLWQTQNGGKTWEPVYQIPPGSNSQVTKVQFVNLQHGWATLLNDLYKTENGGRTWNRVVTPLDYSYASLRTFHLEFSGQSGWIAGAIYNKGAVFRTDDGGLSWQEQKIPQPVGRFTSIMFTSRDQLWVTGDAGVFQTTNRGRTWTTGRFRRECEDYFDLQDTYPIASFFIDGKLGWLVFSSGLVAHTKDGGRTWCDLFDPETLWPPDRAPVGPTPRFQNFHFATASYGVGLGSDRFVYETIDGGATWKREGTVLSFESLAFFENASGWAISKDGDLYQVQLEPAVKEFAREEPRQLIDIFTDADRFIYKGYEVRKFTRKAPSDMGSEVEISYATLARNKRRLLRFDGVYFGMGNSTEFGLFDMLGRGSEQIIVSQTVPRGGRHWVVSVTPAVRVLFDSGDYGVGREEFFVIDIDKDGVYEIVLPVTAFYALQDKMYIGEIPLPEIIFKYDAKARRYLPANHRFVDYALHGIERDMYRLRNDGHSNYLSRRLHILLRYIYAKQAGDGWATFLSTYQRPDRKEIIARIQSVLNDDPVYNYLY